MINLRRAAERFHTRTAWLDSRHTFSFGEHYDAAHMGFRALRVINEDHVRGGGGFPPHPHRDMEIVSYVLEGTLGHRDSLGNGSVIRSGEIQRMTAGTGVVHSEMNASPTEPVHFLQIWIIPASRGLPPGYEQQPTRLADARGRLRRIAGPDGGDGAVELHQDATLLAGRLEAGDRIVHDVAAGRHAWVQVARGAVTLAGFSLAAGDGAGVSDEARVELHATEPSEVLVFDLA